MKETPMDDELRAAAERLTSTMPPWNVSAICQG